jgi:hypothetical protein
VRTSLLPGLLKTIRENRSHALPIRIFETSDVVFKDITRERQARNVRHAAAVWCNKTAGFEIVHGLLDRAMAMLEVPHIPGGGSSSGTGSGGGNQTTPTTRGYYLKERSGTSVVVWTSSFTFRNDANFLLFCLFVWVLKRRPDILSRSRRNNLLSHGAHRKNSVREGDGCRDRKAGYPAPERARKVRDRIPVLGT